jgi:hypothetical protein
MKVNLGQHLLNAGDFSANLPHFVSSFGFSFPHLFNSCVHLLRGLVHLHLLLLNGLADGNRLSFDILQKSLRSVELGCKSVPVLLVRSSGRRTEMR